MNTNRENSLFPPKDFIPTSVIWGVWAAGVMAGVNCMRLGSRRRGWQLIGLYFTLQAAIWVGFGYLQLLLSASKPVFFAGCPESDIQLNWSWLLLLCGMAITNGAFGYRLRVLQQEVYQQWATEHSDASLRSPYLAPWTIATAIAGTILVVGIIGFVLLR